MSVKLLANNAIQPIIVMSCIVRDYQVMNECVRVSKMFSVDEYMAIRQYYHVVNRRHLLVSSLC